MSDDDLRFIRKFPDKCCAEVTRGGESQPCDKTAVAVTVDAENGHWWPVCHYHGRTRRLVPLADLLAAQSELGLADQARCGCGRTVNIRVIDGQRCYDAHNPHGVREDEHWVPSCVGTFKPLGWRPSLP